VGEGVGVGWGVGGGGGSVGEGGGGQRRCNVQEAITDDATRARPLQQRQRGGPLPRGAAPGRQKVAGSEEGPNPNPGHTVGAPTLTLTLTITLTLTRATRAAR
jgi:hypothetical protein